MSNNILFTVHDSIYVRNIISYNIEYVSDIDNILQNSFEEDQEELSRNNNINLEIECETITSSESDKLEIMCTICCSNFIVNDKISKLKCDHTFHHNCIKEWGYYKSSCPLCKQSIPTINNN
jgi:hypothetical protein|tara:strand:+ start:2203 stop:2568 length:366 start_codon:yes stop_codon:yes gene_type:complete